MTPFSLEPLTQQRLHDLSAGTWWHLCCSSMTTADDSAINFWEWICHNYDYCVSLFMIWSCCVTHNAPILWLVVVYVHNTIHSYFSHHRSPFRRFQSITVCLWSCESFIRTFILLSWRCIFFIPWSPSILRRLSWPLMERDLKRTFMLSWTIGQIAHKCRQNHKCRFVHKCFCFWKCCDIYGHTLL